MLGTTAEPPPSPPPAHAPDVGVHLRPPPAPDHAPDTGVARPPPSPPVAVTAPPPPHAPVPVAAADGEKRRPPKAPPKKSRSPLVPVVGSPGINAMLSQTSPKTIGVKRSSPKQYEIPCRSHRSKRRKLKSEIWNDFDPIYGDGNKLKEAQCKHYKRVFVATREVGTSSCTRHLLVCEERGKVNEFLDSVKSTMSQSDLNKSKKWQYDPDRAHLEMLRMIVLHELPFRIVEYEGFRQFVRSLNPTFEFVSRSTVRLHCVDLFNEQKAMLRELLQELNSRVSLTADLWTSNQVVSYMCITCHYVDERWRLRKKSDLVFRSRYTARWSTTQPLWFLSLQFYKEEQCPEGVPDVARPRRKCLISNVEQISKMLS